MSSNRQFRGIWIPAALWNDVDFSVNEKIVLMEIDSFDNDFGCVASNQTISTNLNLSDKAVSNIIQSLKKKDAIDITYTDYNSFSGRKIHVTYRPLLLQRPEKTPRSRGVHSHVGGYTAMEGGTQRREHSNTFSNTFSNSSISTNVDTEHSEKKKKPEVQAKLFEESKKKPKEKRPSYRQEVIDFFHEFYLQEKNTKYKFQQKDFGNISNIVKAIKEKLIEEGGIPPSDEEVSDATKYFISASYHNGNDWFKNNFTISLVYSQFNQSFSNLKNGINGNSRKSKISSEREKLEQLFS